MEKKITGFVFDMITLIIVIGLAFFFRYSDSANSACAYLIGIWLGMQLPRKNK